jgi:hypothetical protein
MYKSALNLVSDLTKSLKLPDKQYKNKVIDATNKFKTVIGGPQ